MNRVLPFVRMISRLLSLVVLAGAVCLTVLDATRSIAAERWVLTPLQQSWNALWPDGLSSFQAWAERALTPSVREGLVQPVFDCPGWAALGALALALGVFGYQPEPLDRHPARRLG